MVTTTRRIFAAALICIAQSAFALSAWDEALVEFDLEGGPKTETILWLSGYAYSSTEFLQSVGCMEHDQYIESKELIGALNRAFEGKRITSEMATRELGRYLRASYACAAYSKEL